MAILKATILSRVNKICKRAETDIDDILLESMREISERTGSVLGQATGVTTANVAYISAPSDLAGRLIHSVYLNSDDPKQEITWSQYLNGNIDGFCIYDGKVYLRPSPTNSTDTYVIDYSKIDDDVDSIELDEAFQAALVRLTAAKLYEKYERYDEIEKQITLYERALSLLSGKSPIAPVSQYNGQEL